MHKGVVKRNLYVSYFSHPMFSYSDRNYGLLKLIHYAQVRKTRTHLIHTRTHRENHAFHILTFNLHDFCAEYYTNIIGTILIFFLYLYIYIYDGLNVRAFIFLALSKLKEKILS